MHTSAGNAGPGGALLEHLEPRVLLTSTISDLCPLQPPGSLDTAQGIDGSLIDLGGVSRVAVGGAFRPYLEPTGPGQDRGESGTRRAWPAVLETERRERRQA